MSRVSSLNSRPSNEIVPASHGMMSRIIVVFPAPLGPRSPRISPRRTFNDTSSTAVTLANLFLTRDTFSICRVSRCQPVDHSWERDGLTHMVEPADPGNRALHPQPEP